MKTRVSTNLPETIRSRLRSPSGPRARLSPRDCQGAAGAALPGSVAYQMDLYQAERLREELAEVQQDAQVVTAPDLWDLPADFQTVLYITAQGRRARAEDRHGRAGVPRPAAAAALRRLVALRRPTRSSRAAQEDFRQASTPTSDGRHASSGATREGDRPRRRHEVTFQARIGGGASCRFLSRPGTFSYGRFDDGARALVEVMEVEPGDRVAGHRLRLRHQRRLRRPQRRAGRATSPSSTATSAPSPWRSTTPAPTACRRSTPSPRAP